MANTRVLIIDDSSYARHVIREILLRNGFEVVGEARDGEEGLESVMRLKPDVVTLDITMPKMDGLQFLHQVMRVCPVRVVVVSVWAREAAPLTVQCLEAGAVDFVPKVSMRGENLQSQEHELISKLKAAAKAKIAPPSARLAGEPASSRTQRRGAPIAVALGASTGGPRNVVEMISRLPGDFSAPIIYVQHMPATFTPSYAGRINLAGPLKCKEAEEGEELLPGVIYVVPGDKHINVIPSSQANGFHRVKLTLEPSDTLFRPSVDVMMCSVVDAYGTGAIGVLMTGMGRDGAKGMKAIKAAGGKTIAESKETAVIWGMPHAAIEENAVDEILPCPRIADALVKLVMG